MLRPLYPRPTGWFLAVEGPTAADLTEVVADLTAAADLDTARRAERDRAARPMAGRLLHGLLAEDRSARELADLLADLGLTAQPGERLTALCCRPSPRSWSTRGPGVDVRRSCISTSTRCATGCSASRS